VDVRKLGMISEERFQSDRSQPSNFCEHKEIMDTGQNHNHTAEEE